MCESALQQVEEVIDAARVIATDLHGVRRHVVLLALESGTPVRGEWLVVHSGYAIGRVGADEAAAALAELGRAGNYGSETVESPSTWREEAGR